MEKKQESHHLERDYLDRWVACQVKFREIMSEEESYWQTRARLQWLLEGDLNTKFFHVCASNRKKKNTILSLEHE